MILDTGPLVALVDGRDKDHVWSVAQWSDIEPPLLTCESVISEACFLLARTRAGGTPVLEMLARGALVIAFRLDEHVRGVRTLMRKYADVPMSLADACLVRMAEVTAHGMVLTLDRDFTIYRRHGRQVIPLVIPASRTRQARTSADPVGHLLARHLAGRGESRARPASSPR